MSRLAAMRRLAMVVIAGYISAILLASCATPSSSEEAAGIVGEGAAPSADADRTLAEREVYTGLTRGVARYSLTPGDVVRLLYTGNSHPRNVDYVIGVRDKLRIDFFYHPQVSRTLVVRPDGRITMPLKGDVVAAGQTPTQLAEHLRELYRDVYRDPEVTVSVEEYSSVLTDVNDSLKNSAEGRGKDVVIAPDGLAFVPLLPPVRAAGRTVEEFQSEINRLYEARVSDVTVSVSLEKVAGDRVFVFGEVRNPGLLALTGPRTALQAISAAGGNLPSGALDRVKVLYWSADGESRLRTLDLEAALEGNAAHGDMLLPANTVVYVPPSTITKVDRIVDQYIRQLFLFNGWGFSWFYNLNPQKAVTVP